MKTILFLFLFSLFAIGSKLSGQQLRYEPVNPNFGGNYLNYSWLLSSANAQNPFDNQDDSSLLKNSALSSLSDNIKRQILNQLTRSLLSDSSDAPVDGEPIEIGGLIITIEETRTGSIITIIDSETGETTEIIL